MDIFKDLLLPIASPLLGVVIASYYAIHLKYADSKEEAFGLLKRSCFQIVIVLLVGWTVYILISELLSDGPLTRYSVFMIASSISMLVFYTLVYLFVLLINQQTAMISLLEKPSIRTDKYTG